MRASRAEENKTNMPNLIPAEDYDALSFYLYFGILLGVRTFILFIIF